MTSAHVEYVIISNYLEWSRFLPEIRRAHLRFNWKTLKEIGRFKSELVNGDVDKCSYDTKSNPVEFVRLQWSFAADAATGYPRLARPEATFG